MAEAAARIEQHGFFGVDINFGCAVSVMCKKNLGAAILKDPILADRIITKVRKAVHCPVSVKFRTGWRDDPDGAVRMAVHCPVSVKFRTGWRDDPDGAVRMAKLFEEAGANALIFHPRIAPDRRSRPPNWKYISLIKKAVEIPVFGNGNIFSTHDCIKMFETTGCDGVAIGRLAVVKPWIFAEWTGRWKPKPDTLHHTAQRLAKLMVQYFDPEIALQNYKKFFSYYSANFKFGHDLYTRISNSGSVADIQAILQRFFESPPEMAGSPNISLLR
jgi:tRNA-dihydrouridine synthase